MARTLASSRSSIALACLTSAALALSACASSRTRTPAVSHVTPALEREIRSANDRLEALYKKGDNAALAAMYTDDAVILSHGGREWRGRAAVDGYWNSPNQVPVDWQLEILGLDGRDDIVAQHGRSTLKYRIKDTGEERASIVRFVGIWRRQRDGSWKLQVDAYWPDKPPAPSK